MSAANIGREAPIYGNYHSYYQTKRPTLGDSRIALLSPDFFRAKTVLDIGCNEGWISCEIAQQHGASRVLGVDIDETLINATWRHLHLAWSLQAPSSVTDRDAKPLPKKKRRKDRHGVNPSPADVSRPESSRGLTLDNAHYFPASMPTMLGDIPMPPATSANNRLIFPHNVTFETVDWVSNSPHCVAEKFDVILALSVTKWIHLNYEDQGLLSFFAKIFDSLHAGRAAKLVLEPQDWESYAKARKMNERLRENARGLRLRPEGFEDELVKIGFRRPMKLGSVGQGGFRRRIEVYERP